MSSSMTAVQAAQAEAAANRPRQHGFPTLAATLRRAGVRRYECRLPSMQMTYGTALGMVVDQLEPLIRGMVEVAPFDRDALVAAIRADQAGVSTFPEFARAAWHAGVVGWTVDLDERVCTYFGWDGRSFAERYPDVDLRPDAG